MKKTNLIWITAFMFIVISLNTYAWLNCAPSSCSSGYTDNGIYCQEKYCYRNCTTLFCSSTDWALENSDSCSINNDYQDEEDCDTSSFTYTNISQCYKFKLNAGDPSVNIEVVDPPQDVGGMDCDSHAWAGYTGSWFKNLDNYLGDVEGTRFDYKLEGMYSHSEADSDSTYSNTAREDYSIYCAPGIPACDDLSSYGSDCDTTCYGNSTSVYFYQGYQKDYDTRSDQEDLYYNAGCGDANVDGWNTLDYNYLKTYSKPTTTVNDDTVCEKTNEAPTASNVIILPTTPNAGNDLTCNYTYSDPEDYEEKDSFYNWTKNGVDQGINSRNLLKGNLSVNDTWSCKVTPSDGLLNGTIAGSSNITIASTVQNPKMYIENLVWSVEGYYSERKTLSGLAGELNDALETCTPGVDGYCNISITFSSDSAGKMNLSSLGIYHRERHANLTINSFQELSSSGTSRVFEIVVLNNGDYTLQDLSWTLDFGDGSRESEYNFTLAPGEDILLLFKHNFSSDGYEITINVTNDSIYAQQTLSGNDALLLTELLVSYSDVKRKTFGMKILNNGSSPINSLNWSIDTGETLLYADSLFNLTSGEEIFVIADYNYTSQGIYTVIGTAFSLNESISGNITINVTG